jgi:flagellar FliJ protein
MKPFRFSLDSVLEFRREIEEQWEIKLARANGEYNQLALEIERISGEEREALEGCSHSTGSDTHSWGVYRWRLESTKNQLKLALAAKDVERSRIRSKFVEVSRDRKVLSKLKDRKLGEYRKYKNREEIKRLDDISAAKMAGEGVR